MKKTTAILLALMLFAGLLSSCNGGGGGATPADGKKTLVLAESSQWWGADTVLLDGSSFTQGLIADPIVALDENGDMVPCIAEAVNVSEDGLTITLTIPKGMYFASGEELLPEDVVASLERFKESAPFADNLAAVDSIEVKGQDVVLTLAAFTSDIASSLSGSFITVQDKDVLDSTSNDDLLWGAKPYGPYYLSEYVEGSHVVLLRNVKYWTNNPNVKNKHAAYYEQITVRFISEEFTMANALNIGDIDGTFGISSEGVAQLTKEDLEVKTFVTIPNINYLEFNCDSPLLSDARVRDAIAMICDREAIKEANSGLVIPAYSIITEGTPNMSKTFEEYYKANYDTDREKAKALLAEAGWADSDGDGYLDKEGKTMELLIVANDNVIENNTVQSLQIQMREMGIKLNIQMYADYYHYDVIAAGDYDIGLEHFGWQEPVLLLRYALTDVSNLDVMGITSEYYEAVSKIQHTVDYDERTKYVEQVEHYLADNSITVPLYSDMVTMVFTSYAEGMVFHPGGSVYFNDMGF